MTSATFSGSPRQSLLWVALLFWLWSAAIAQNTTSSPTVAPGTATAPPTSSGWQGCVDPNNGTQLVTIGEPTTICLNIANGGNWSESRTYMRLNFQPLADQYSRFHVPLSYQELVQDTSTRVSQLYTGNDITVFVASQQGISYQKVWYNSANASIFPFLTAIIDVSEGIVQGIVWDDASIFCGSKEQSPNTMDFTGFEGTSQDFGQPVDACFVTTTQCNTNTNTSTGCDLLLYVVWTGTDANKRPFLSSSYRYSAFPPQDWADRITANLPPIPKLPDMPDLNPLN